MKDPNEAVAAMHAALNKLCKWRNVLAGWQLGTRTTEDPESNAVKDQREAIMIMRAELTALTGLLTARGVFTTQEFCEAVTVEAAHLDHGFEERFPGFSTTSSGVTMKAPEAAETMKRYRFKP